MVKKKIGKPLPQTQCKNCGRSIPKPMEFCSSECRRQYDKIKVKVTYADYPRCSNFGKLKLPIETMHERCIFCADLHKCMEKSKK